MPHSFKQRGTVVVPLAESPVPMVEIESTDNPATFSETVAGEDNITGMTIYGKSAQATTTGANILNPDWLSDNSDKIFDSYDLTPGDYTVSFVSTAEWWIGNNNGSSWYIHFYDENDEQLSYIVLDFNAAINVRSSGSFSVPEGTHKTTLFVYSGFTKANVIDLMLNAGTTQLPYEPYTGGKPSPSPEYPQEIHSAGDEGEIDVGVIGAQLFPINLAASRNGMTVTHNEDGTINVTGTPNCRYANVFSNSITLSPGTYYLSSNGSTSAGSLTPQIAVFASDGTPIRYYLTNGIVTVPENTSRIVMTIQYQASELVELNISNFFVMFNVGSTPLPFEPYQSQSLTFQTTDGLPGIPVDSGGNFVDETGQGWMCNYRDWARGVDVQNFGACVVDGSTLKFQYNGNPDDSFWELDYYTAPNVDHSKVNSYWSTYFLPSAFGANSNYSFLWTRPNYMAPYGFTAVDELNAFCVEKNSEGKPLTIMYALTAPIETPIPADELAAYQALQTYDGTTVFSMDSGEPAASWEVKALVVDPNNTNPQVMRLWLDEETGQPVNINGRGARVGDTPTQHYILQPCSF